jgi:hypothetical protein
MFVSDSFGKLADLAGELTGAGLIYQSRQRRSQAGALPGNPGSDKKPENRQSDHKKKVDDSDCPNPSVDNLFQSSHRRVNEVGEENGEKKKNQGSPRRIEKAQPHGEEERREQNARSA